MSNKSIYKVYMLHSNKDLTTILVVLTFIVSLSGQLQPTDHHPIPKTVDAFGQSWVEDSFEDFNMLDSGHRIEFFRSPEVYVVEAYYLMSLLRI